VLRLLLVVGVVAAATVFAVDNMHRVELGLVVGRPVHVRLFFLLLISFLVGCFAAVLTELYFSARFKKGEEPARAAEGEDFFSE